MIPRMLKAPAQDSFFLLGSRGSGKTAWLQRHFKNSIYIDLLESQLYIELLANPEKLASLIPAKVKGHIILDEIQKVPELLNEVHRLIEKKNYKFM